MEPRLRITPARARPGKAPGEWRTAWLVRNDGARAVDLVEGWLPNGKFRGARRKLGLKVAPGNSQELDFAVRCAEPPGTIVENAFLILRVLAGDAPWRVLARVTVEVDATGVPVPRHEATSVQPVGFGGDAR